MKYWRMQHKKEVSKESWEKARSSFLEEENNYLKLVQPEYGWKKVWYWNRKYFLTCAVWQGNCIINFFFFFGHFRATSIAYGSSMAKGWIKATAIATAMPDPSHICNLYHSSQQCWILNPLSKARDRTWVLMDTSWVHYYWAMMGTPEIT